MHDLQTTIRGKYMKIWKLLNKCKGTKSNEHKEKCVALLKEIVEELNATVTSFTEKWNKDLILAITYLHLGILYSKMDQKSAAMEKFEKCTHMLEGRELKAEVISPAIYSLNQLGRFYTKWNIFEEAKVSLEKAEKLYIIFTKNVNIDPVSISITVDAEDPGEMRASDFLEKLHVVTLKYMMRLYDKLMDQDNSMWYGHRKLSKELNLDKMMINLNYIDWVFTAAIISQHYKDEKNFSQARYYLAAASYVLEKYRNKLDSKGPKENFETEYKAYNKASADIAVYWIKYGLALVEVSHEVKENIETNVSQSDSEVLTFEDIDTVELEAIISQVTDQYLQDSEAYKTLFLNILKWSDQAKKYYTPDNHMSNYLRIEFDINEACRYLLTFKFDDVYIEKMLKERIKVLERRLKKLYPPCHRIYCQKIWLELGDLYTDILGIIKGRYLFSKENPTAHLVRKINRLARRNIKYFRSYLDFVELGESNDVMGSFQTIDIHKVIYASFRIGELYGCMTTSDVHLKIKITQHRLEAYQLVVSYCDKRPEEESEMKAWIETSKEHVNRLPLMLFRLRQQSRNQ